MLHNLSASVFTGLPKIAVTMYIFFLYWGALGLRKTPLGKEVFIRNTEVVYITNNLCAILVLYLSYKVLYEVLQ